MNHLLQCKSLSYQAKSVKPMAHIPPGKSALENLNFANRPMPLQEWRRQMALPSSPQTVAYAGPSIGLSVCSQCSGSEPGSQKRSRNKWRVGMLKCRKQYSESLMVSMNPTVFSAAASYSTSLDFLVSLLPVTQNLSYPHCLWKRREWRPIANHCLRHRFTLAHCRRKERLELLRLN